MTLFAKASVAIAFTMLIALMLIVLTPERVPGQESVICFADAKLEAAVREAVSKPAGDLLQADLKKVTVLNVPGRMIGRLDGIEYLTGLKRLDLSYNTIVDLSPLAELSQLKRLNLAYNDATDYTPLSKLVSLEILDLHGNPIQDISFLAGLHALKKLNLGQNYVRDISALSGMVSLEKLDLTFNEIADLSPISQLTSLNKLYLGYNQIQDITPLARLGGLRDLELPDNRIEDISALTRLTALQQVDLRGNRIRDLTALVDNEGLGWGDEIDVGDNPLEPDVFSSQIPSLKVRRVRIWPIRFDQYLMVRPESGDVSAAVF